MEHDYYQILAVEPSADLDAIKKAFRRKVMVCHPDRGGSHAEMVLVNEAWEVLSNPESRRRYDEAFNNAGDRAAQDAAGADAQQAHQRAEQYPQRWADYEKWLDSALARDFTSASYRSSPDFGRGIGLGGLHFPIVDDSKSGWLLIVIGAILGGVFVSPAIFQFITYQNHAMYWKFTILAIAGPIAGGAWVGKFIHEWIRDQIKTKKKQVARKGEREAQGAASEPHIIGCKSCGQKLRVPSMQSELLVTCPACGNKFSWRGGPA